MKYTLIKLFIGLVLFGTLVAMRLLNVIDADIKNLCIGGLMGLGIMHLGGGSQVGIGGASPDKNGGFARVPALIMSAMLAAIALTACTTTSTRDAQVAYAQSCAAYGAAFDVALQLRKAGKLNDAQVRQVTLMDSQITPICTGPLPNDPNAATVQVTAAIATLSVLEAIK